LKKKPFELKIVRADSPTPTYRPMNGIKVSFKLAVATPIDQELRVDI
jgi:hypothetical protein